MEQWGHQINLYLNDINNDQDGDGLGAGLEGALGTCDQKPCYQPSNPSYSVVEPRDTDGDGISDYLEVFGKETLQIFQPPHILYLPAWGANPRHKDMFIEVDYLGGYVNQDPHPFIYNASAYDTTPPQGQPRGGQHDLHESLLAIQQAFNKHGSSWSLKNPDGQHGVSLHFDVGYQAPTGYETLYGNWGGSNIVPRWMDTDAKLGLQC
jgi:hypothetical protein